MRQLIFVGLFLMNTVAAHASEGRKTLLARAGYKEAVKVTKISDGGMPQSSLIVLTQNGELRMVEGLYHAVNNRRENEMLIANEISEIAIVSGRLIAVDHADMVSFVEPKSYSLNQFTRDLHKQGGHFKVFFPWSMILANFAMICVPEVGVAAFGIGACAQLAVAGRMYRNREKVAKPREAVLYLDDDTESRCEKALAPLVKYRYEVYNP